MDDAVALRAHIVGKTDQARGYVEGVAIRALCGHTFIPSRDPVHLPPCEPCQAAYAVIAFINPDARRDDDL